MNLDFESALGATVISLKKNGQCEKCRYWYDDGEDDGCLIENALHERPSDALCVKMALAKVKQERK